MSVEIRLFAAARAAARTGQATGEAGSLASLTHGLAEAYPELRAVLPQCSFLIDGVAVHGDPTDVVIEDGASVDVLPPFAGG